MTGIAQKLQPQNSGSPNYYVVIGLNSELADQAGYSPWVTSVDPTATLPPALIQDVRQEQPRRRITAPRRRCCTTRRPR